MGKERKTGKTDKARRLDADLPVKNGAAVKGGNDLGPDNIQRKHTTTTTTTTPSTSA